MYKELRMLITKLTFLNTHAEAVPDLRLHSLDLIKMSSEGISKFKKACVFRKKIKAYVKGTRKADWYSMVPNMSST